MTTNNEQEQQEQRTAEYLIDHWVPYSEMTDNEIESVVEYKASIVIRDQEYADKMAIAAAESAARVEKLESNAQAASDSLNSLLDKLLTN